MNGELNIKDWEDSLSETMSLILQKLREIEKMMDEAAVEREKCPIYIAYKEHLKKSSETNPIN